MWVTIATFNQRAPAELVSERLEKAGIGTEIVDETKLQRYWYLAPKPLANIRLKVWKDDFHRADQLLREWDRKEGILREAIHCPECGGSRIQYPQFTRNFILPTVLALLRRIHLFKAYFYCQDCQYTWLPGTEKPSL